MVYRAFILIAVLHTVSCWAAGENLVRNSGFEQIRDQKPVAWTIETSNSNARAELSRDAQSGSYSFMAGVGKENAGITCTSDAIKVIPGATYTISLYYKCSSLNAGPATVIIYDAKRGSMIDWNLPNVAEWTFWQQTFCVGEGDTELSIGLLNYYRTGQTIWYDNITLENCFVDESASGHVRSIAKTDKLQTVEGKRPYELKDRGPDFPIDLIFTDADAWVFHSSGVEATAALSGQEVIWSPGSLRVRYSAPPRPDLPSNSPVIGIGGRMAGKPVGGSGRFNVRPRQPIAITKKFDAMQMWVNADMHFKSNPPTLYVEFIDGDGKTLKLRSATVNWMYWFLTYVPIPANAKRPLSFNGFSVEGLVNTAPLDLYFDAISFIQAPRTPITPKVWDEPLPFPTTTDTILPSIRSKVDNALTVNGDTYTFTCATDDGPVQYTYKPNSGTLADVAVLTSNEGVWQPFDNSSFEIYGEDGLPFNQITRTLIEIRREGNMVVSRWRVASKNKTFVLSYTFEVKGKTLMITVAADQPAIRLFTAGRIANIPAPRIMLVPYAKYTRYPQVNVLITPKNFAAIDFDLYNTESSAFYGADTVTGNSAAIFGGVLYEPNTAGKLETFKEKIFLTVSNHFDEILRNIPNPASPNREDLRTNLFVSRMHYGGPVNDYDTEITLWQKLKAMGMDRLLIRFHADFWRSRESFTYKTQATPSKGGDKKAFEFLSKLRDLGYRYGLYTDYMLMSPLSEFWKPDYAALAPDGDRSDDSYSAYFVKPALGPEIHEIAARKVHEKFGTSLSYNDQMSQANCGWIEFDARVPRTTQQKTTLNSYGRIMLNDRIIHQGPTYSEGGYNSIWAGLTDASYAQTFEPDAPAVVDFALLKIHPLCGDVGYDLGSSLGDDRQLAMQVVYGNGGMLWAGPWGAHVDGMDYSSLMRMYYMMQQLQYRYVMEPVKSIAYFDGNEFVDSDTALHGDAWKRGQVKTVYRNGLVTITNANPGETLKVSCNKTAYELHPYGFIAYAPDGFWASSTTENGHKIDWVKSDAYIYCDPYGVKIERNGVEVDRQTAVVKISSGVKIIPFQTSNAQVGIVPGAFSLPNDGDVTLRFFDMVGTQTATSKVRAVDNKITVTFPKDAFYATLTME